ncbi:hypothetical protein B0H19DRAFT_1272099 [Mycena capillaripes]|nr:hypothetical protein B0H19DRAFT_1272099 [Mycena capillaripes]
MHRALCIPEIVELICAQYKPYALGPIKKDAFRALSVLGRTSKMFSDPALNELWSRQESMVQLLKCMPDDLWDITQQTEGTDEVDGLVYISIHLRRSITSSDWERPRFYSHRVKSFIWLPDTCLCTPDVFEALGLCLLSDPVFPNLAELHWHPDSPHSFHHIRLFLTSRLTKIHLSSIQTMSHLSLLSNLAVKCPCLKDVDIYVEEGFLTTDSSNSLIPIISRFVSQLGRLESANVPGLDGRAFAYLAQLLTLESLELRSLDLPQFHPIPGETACFPALTRLTGLPMGPCTRMITMMTNCSLVNIYGSVLGDELSPWPTKALPEDSIPPWPLAAHIHHCKASICPLGDILEPLLSFSNLVKVSLTHPVGFDLDNATILAMACAWPRLQSLLLIASPYRHIPSRVTLEGLYALAKYCPNLSDLCLTFDATVVPHIEDDAVETVRQTVLHTINVGASPTGAPRPVAEFLSAIFPGLDSIETLLEDLLEQSDGQVTGEPEVAASYFAWRRVEEQLGVGRDS